MGFDTHTPLLAQASDGDVTLRENKMAITLKFWLYGGAIKVTKLDDTPAALTSIFISP